MFLLFAEFHPDGQTLQVRTWSPLLQRSLTDDANRFTFSLGPGLWLPGFAHGAAAPDHDTKHLLSALQILLRT